MGVIPFLEPERSDAGAEGLPVEIRCFPTSDDEFRTHVEALVGAWDRSPMTPESLAARLAAAYPRIRVEPQSSLGGLGPGAVLYLYRDGHL